jgi:hypothetical protein
MIMKKILYILMALMCIAGCKEPTPTPPTPGPGPDPVPPGPEPVETLASKIVTEWHCTVSDIDADIYLSLGNFFTFELYQKIGEGAYRLYKGTWELDEDTAMLSGKYNDGTPWGSGYAVAVSEDGNSMTLTSSTGSEEQTYRKESVPAAVKDGCVVVVKSDGGIESPVL